MYPPLEVGKSLEEVQAGKIQLYSHELEAAGFDPMPKLTLHPQPEEGFYRLIYGRAPMHTFSRTANNRNLGALMPENSATSSK